MLRWKQPRRGVCCGFCCACCGFSSCAERQWAAWSGEQAVTWSWLDQCGIGMAVVLILGMVRKSGDAGVCPEKIRKHLWNIYKCFWEKILMSWIQCSLVLGTVLTVLDSPFEFNVESQRFMGLKSLFLQRTQSTSTGNICDRGVGPEVGRWRVEATGSQQWQWN